jgi:hypothetical protein
MDVRTLIVELVKAGAWPLVTLIVALTVRRPMMSVIDGLKLKTMKGGGFEAEFQVLSAEVRREVSALPAAPKEAALSAKRFEAVELGSGPAARGAIVSTWLEVENAVDLAARDAGITAVGFPEKLRALGAKGMLEAATIDAVTGLRMMRNMAVHAPEPISDDKARDFVSMANAVVFAISMNLKKRGRT